MGARVLVVGSGGREHALVAALAADPAVDTILAAPGNPGIAELARCAPVRGDDVDGLVALARSERVDLVVVGPEVPLVLGLADALRAREVPVFGPVAAAARLEGSKAFAKDVMAAAGVPTALWTATSDRAVALAALDRSGPPWVVKADGLAAGKGVVVTDVRAEADRAVEDALVARRFGEAGATVVVEGFLAGPERSLFAVCDGEDAVLLAPAQDHKRVGDGDTGPNTGGMGAFSPVPGFALGDARVGALLGTHVLPVLREMARRGAPFRGLLYVGLVDTADGPQVLEFNVRLGDPEAQVVLPRLASSPYAVLRASATGSSAGRDGVATVPVAFRPDAAVTVVLASGGYPGEHRTGLPIVGVEAAAATGAHVFHAGTARDADGRLVTAGGRVLAVTGLGPDLAAARAAAYGAADLIRFEGLHRRADIAASAG